MEDAKKEFKNYKINDDSVPDFIIERCIQREHEKYGELGSWRGWARFTRSSIEKDIAVEYQKLCNLRDCLDNSSIFMNYVYELLYKPGGLRYNDVKFHFESCVMNA
tara:strand:- start:1254 stop:1571 length:318 start_codon:yes stop_codon:yes gene_type:complete